jgi:SAM-dependent methyltransferase
MDDELFRSSRSFDTVAGAYDRGRPSYPSAAVEFMVGPDQRTVLEVGAGTGKLTEQLVALGHDVHATDPSSVLLGVLTDRLPGVRTSVARAEELPLLDGSVDVVACAQAFHWFDQEAALAEFARVLRPGGHLALAWNTRDVKVPWVRRLGAIIGDQDTGIKVPDSLVRSTEYGFVEESSHRFWQVVNSESLCDMAMSRSNVAVLDGPDREAKLAEVRSFYADYGRGADGMQLPWITRCFRATVIEHPWSVPRREGADEGEPTKPMETDESLLIDFR